MSKDDVEVSGRVTESGGSPLALGTSGGGDIS